MKKIGIVGGVSWLSTVDYYTEICRRSEQPASNPAGESAVPEISIESLDHHKAVSYLGRDADEESWSRFDEYHRAALQRLEASGADFALIASNTPHHRLRSITRGVGIPVISIFAAAAKESARIGATEVLILGTPLTMSSAVFREEFAKYGVRAAGPADESARAMTRTLIQELEREKFEGAAERLARIARTAIRQPPAAQPVVCLACTELPLAFPEHKTLSTFDADGIRYINSTIVHVRAALDFAMKKAGG